MLASLFLLHFTSNAQLTGSYWSHNYGSTGSLLQGAVLSSNDDYSATYYNPATIGMTGTGVSFSIITPNINAISIEGMTGTSTVSKSGEFYFFPQIISSHFRLFKNPKLRSSILLITKNSNQVNLYNRETSVAIDNPGRIFIGNTDYHSKSHETWAAFGTSYQLSPNTLIGMSLVSSFLSQDNGLEVNRQLADKSNPSSIYKSEFKSLASRYSSSFRFFNKIGISHKWSHVNAGLTVTTPTWAAISNFAQVKYNFQKFDDNSFSSLSNSTDKAKLDYKTPWSIGAGLDFPFLNGRLNLAAENFFAIKSYDLVSIDNNPYGDLAVPEKEKLAANISTRNVLNVAVSYSRKINDKYGMVLGFRSDGKALNAAYSKPSDYFFVPNWTNYHVSYGNNLKAKNNNQLTVTLDMGFGGVKNAYPVAAFQGVGEANFFNTPVSPTTKIRQLQWMILFNYDFIFKMTKPRK